MIGTTKPRGPQNSIELKMNTFTEYKLRVIGQNSKTQLRKTFSKLLSGKSISQKDQRTFYYCQLLRQPNEYLHKIQEPQFAPISALPPLEPFIAPNEKEEYLFLLLTEPKVVSVSIHHSL